MVSRLTAYLAASLFLGNSLSLVADEQPALSTVQAIVSVADQKIAVVRDGLVVAKYPISTSRFGIGDQSGSYKTPLGNLRVYEKLGDDLPQGAVIKHRRATGEVLKVNAPGRDPIVTRILWLDGTEAQNENARERSIYIHGTPEEKLIGKPASYGCIRMRSKDVVALYENLAVGSSVSIIPERLPRMAKYSPPSPRQLAKADEERRAAEEKERNRIAQMQSMEAIAAARVEGEAMAAKTAAEIAAIKVEAEREEAAKLAAARTSPIPLATARTAQAIARSADRSTKSPDEGRTTPVPVAQPEVRKIVAKAEGSEPSKQKGTVAKADPMVSKGLPAALAATEAASAPRTKKDEPVEQFSPGSRTSRFNEEAGDSRKIATLTATVEKREPLTKPHEAAASSPLARTDPLTTAKTPSLAVLPKSSSRATPIATVASTSVMPRGSIRAPKVAETKPPSVPLPVDPDRLAFIRSREAQFATEKGNSLSSPGVATPSNDLSGRLKGSILDSNLPH